MKHNEFLEKEYDKFFAKVESCDPTEKKQFVTFLKWCFENNFLDNLSKEDLEYFYEEDEICLPLLKNNGITIGVDCYNFSDRTYLLRVGIDPSKCFNKTSQCSVLERFPISNREEKAFYKFLDSIMDKKSTISKAWFDDASTSWYGEFRNNA